MIRNLLVVSLFVLLESQSFAWLVLPYQRAARHSSVLLLSSEGDTPTESVASTSPAEDEGSNGPPKEEIPLKRQVQPKAPQLSSNDIMRAMGTSPRRIAISFLSASGIALAGNFLGVTSNLLTAVPEDAVEATGLDTYFPRGDFKRCLGKGYTFVIPKEWVADTFVELAKAQRQTQPLDYSIRKRGVASAFPDSAYGPPGRLNKNGVSESGDTNVSVIVSTGMTGFSLQGTLGTPRSAAEKLLRLSIAPEGSGRVATLVDAVEDPNRSAYQFEYTVDRGEKGPPLRNISVIASFSSDSFYTLTVVAPAKDWDGEAYAEKLRKIASSFHLTS